MLIFYSCVEAASKYLVINNHITEGFQSASLILDRRTFLIFNNKF